MSFFGNIKKITVSSAKAINNGVEVLNNLAEEAEKSSHLLLIKSQASTLEKEINFLANNSASIEEIDEKRQALSEIYNEIIEKTLGPERDEYTRKNKTLKSDIDLSNIKQIAQSIKHKERKLSLHEFKLAITEIRKLQDIRIDLDKLIMITQPKEYKPYHKSAIEKHKVVSSRIDRLQEQRHEETISTYPSGNKKSVIRKYDGENHGLCEFWYENGKKEKEISFANGKATGASKYWRDDGTILSEVLIQPSDKHMTQSGFASSGLKIMELLIKNKNGFIKLWLWDGSFVCRADIKNTKVRKFPALVKAAMRKNVWMNLYKARKKGVYQDHINDMEETTKACNRFLNDLLDTLT